MDTGVVTLVHDGHAHMKEKAFEFIWEGSDNIPANKSAILTHVLEWSYGTFINGGFDWSPTVHSV